MATKTKKEIEKDRQLAKMLFFEDHSQKEISFITGVSEQTISKWAKQEAWKTEKTALAITTQSLIRQNYEQMQNLLTTIKNRGEGKNFATKPESDSLRAYRNEIRALEKDLSISDTISIIKNMSEFIRQTDEEFAKQFSTHSMRYIKHLTNEQNR